MKTSLNHTYRLVWSDALQTFVPVAECARGRGKGGKKSARARSLLLSMALLSGAAVQAQLPTGGQVVAGSASMATQGKTLTITQTSERMAADWQSFSIGQGHTVNFVQPGSNAVALNRVLGSDVSVIQGALNANGQVFLVNPNGVLFTKDAQVNVGGMVASTLNISTQDFMAGHYKFEGASSNAIVNQGRITAHGNGQGGGTVALIAARINNEGTLTAEKGNVLMGAGRKVTLDLGGPVKIQVEEGALDALIKQGGAIKADGGLVYLTAKSAGDLVSTVINHTGITEAQTLATGEKGEIYLMGDMAKGRVSVGGTLDASAPNGGDGGFIETSAAKVSFADRLNITTAAANGKTGQWLIDPVDFTVSASGGDITGSALGTMLGSNSVTIQTVNTGTNTATDVFGTTGTNGDIFVNDSVSWSSANTLTLNAHRNIEINSPITASHASGKLVLEYGQGALAQNNTASYTINAPVNLQSGNNFSTKLGSDGAAINYTVVNSQSDLQTMSLTGNTALGSSLTLTGTNNWTPVGISGFPVTGIFDGLGNTITNMHISLTGSDEVGLFGVVGIGGTIRNIGLINAYVAGRNYVGALAGRSNGTIAQSYVTANVSGRESVGGLLGANTGSVINSYAEGVVSGTRNFVGGLVGETWGSSNVNESHSTVNVSGIFSVGGLVGHSWSGTISQSYATGNVSGQSMVGGLVGYMENGSVSDSSSNATVSGTSTQVGGLIGTAYFDTTGNTLTRNYATGDVSGKTGTGGLIGSLYGNNSSSLGSTMVTVSQSYARGSVVGGNDEASGGLIGEVFGVKAALENLYATGAVSNGTGSNHGGLIGSLNAASTLTRAYATGAVSVAGGGGLIGSNAGAGATNVVSSYWDTETTGKVTSAGGTAKTTAQMKNSATYTGWDTSVWGFFAGRGAAAAGYEVGEGLPFLTGVTRDDDKVGSVRTLFDGGWGGQTAGQQAGADGTAYGVSNWNQLQNINLVLGGGYRFELKNNLDANSAGYVEQVKNGATLANGGLGWKPIGSLRPLVYDAAEEEWTSSGSDRPFVGVFDGKNYSITGLTIQRPTELPGSPAANQALDSSGVGLFGYVSGSSSEIRDLKLIDPFVQGYQHVGAVVGFMEEGNLRRLTAENIAVQGGGYYVGGIVGSLGGNATGLLSSGGQVTGAASGMGGVIGYNEGSVTQSSADVNVTSQRDEAGGLVGSNSGTVTASLASGAVSGKGQVGGLVGYSDGSITSSHALGNVTNTGTSDGTGGLVGTSEGSITDSYASGNVTSPGANYAGGLVGYSDGNISLSYASGEIRGKYGVGGLVGWANSWSGALNTIEKSHASGLVIATDENSGGLVGIAQGTKIENSYASGSVTGTRTVGGLVGSFEGESRVGGPQIINSYAIGPVTGTSNVGGLVGYDSSLRTNAYNSVVSSFWDKQTTGQSTSAGGVGKTTAEMQDIALYSGWSIEDDTSLTDSYARLTMTATGTVWKIKSVAYTSSGGGDADSSGTNNNGGSGSGSGSGDQGASSSGSGSSGTGSSGTGTSGTGSSGTGSSGTGSSGTGSSGTGSSGTGSSGTGSSGTGSSGTGSSGTGSSSTGSSGTGSSGTGSSGTGSSGTGSSGTGSSGTGSSGTGSSGSGSDSSASGGAGGATDTATGSNGGTPDSNTGGSSNNADSGSQSPQLTAAILSAQQAAQQAARQAAGPSGPISTGPGRSTLPTSALTGFNPGLALGSASAAGAAAGGTPAVLSMSGGLAFVNVNASPAESTGSSGQASANAVAAMPEGAGRDPAGFMRVFVVNGGINLPTQASDAAVPGQGVN